jgi:hypothetical protein
MRKILNLAVAATLLASSLVTGQVAHAALPQPAAIAVDGQQAAPDQAASNRFEGLIQEAKKAKPVAVTTEPKPKPKPKATVTTTGPVCTPPCT